MIHTQLGNEADGWAGNGLMGAVSLEEGKIHLTIHEQTSRGEEVAVVTHELKNCFDSIDTAFAMNVGQGLGLPVEVAECKKHTSSKHTKLFSFSGCTDGDWIVAREEVFQGSHRRF